MRMPVESATPAHRRGARRLALGRRCEETRPDMRLVLLLLALAACPATIPKDTFKDMDAPRTRELVLGVGDVVAINVWGQDNKELNTEAKIRPDGTITMPLVGDLKALGQTPSVLKEKIKVE